MLKPHQRLIEPSLDKRPLALAPLGLVTTKAVVANQNSRSVDASATIGMLDADSLITSHFFATAFSGTNVRDGPTRTCGFPP